MNTIIGTKTNMMLLAVLLVSSIVDDFFSQFLLQFSAEPVDDNYSVAIGVLMQVWGLSELLFKQAPFSWFGSLMPY